MVQPKLVISDRRPSPLSLTDAVILMLVDVSIPLRKVAEKVWRVHHRRRVWPPVRQTQQRPRSRQRSRIRRRLSIPSVPKFLPPVVARHRSMGQMSLRFPWDIRPLAARRYRSLPPTPTPETSITLTSSSIAAAVQVPRRVLVIARMLVADISSIASVPSALPSIPQCLPSLRRPP